MFVYSASIIRFVAEIKGVLRRLLSEEARLRCFGDRFYDRLGEKSFPIDVVIYNHRAMLGYFDPHFYELGFHESLIYADKTLLHNVIRHELAHYITFIEHGSTAQPHSAEFLAVCRQFGWGEDVFRAAVKFEPEMDASREEGGVLRKIKKLMALGSSGQAHEAEQAMLKSQQLLLKHHLDAASVESAGEEKIYMQRISKQKKETAKMRAIADILKTFFVSVVFHRADGFTYLEILGDLVNLEIADYVAQYLDVELDHLWEEARKRLGLKGALAKNSFFLGIARGYSRKVENLKAHYNGDTKNALIILERKMIEGTAMAYPKLCTKRSSAGYCPASHRLGEAMGRQMSIRLGLKNGMGHSAERLTYKN